MNHNDDTEDYENNRHQSSQPSVDSPKNEKNIFLKHRQANSFAQKSNAIMGTYSRIVPKKPTHDFERLYAENIRLKERIQFLEENSKKIKTRFAMVEKEKEQLIAHINKQDNGYPGIREKRGSTKGLHKVDEKTKRTNFDENRRILHTYKDEISKLQIENARLKKTIKYTQIQEMEIENQHLQLEMVRIKEYAYEVVNNTDYEEYEKEIGALQKQLIGEKEHSKTYYMQIKKKDEEIEGVKSKMKALVLKKTEMERKYTRDLTTAKEEVQRVKDREKLVGVDIKKELLKQKTSENKEEINGILYKENLESQKQKVLLLEKELKEKEVEMARLNEKIKILESTVHVDRGFKKENTNLHENNYLKSSTEVISKPNQSAEINKSQISEKKSKKIRENKFESNDENSSEQIYTDDYEEVENLKVENTSNKIENHNVINVDDDMGEEEKEEEELYNESFDEIDDKNKEVKNEESEEEVLFQKEVKTAKKHTKKKKLSNHELNNEKSSTTKVIKILQETIKYRLIAQRYSYTDFHRDIIESEATEFTAEELIEMLSNEPFFLSEQHLETVLTGLFEREELEPEDIIKTNVFLSKMKKFIIAFEIPEETEEEQNLKEIKKKLNQINILPKLKEESKGEEISKKGFMKVLKEFGKLNDKEIEQCLAEVSIMSQDISRINYEEFIKKIKSL